MKKVVRLSVIKSERKRLDARSFRKEAHGTLSEIMRDAGDEISGFAIVLWDKDGSSWSMYKTGGPIKARLIPSYAESSLTQHIAADLVKDGN